MVRFPLRSNSLALFGALLAIVLLLYPKSSFARFILQEPSEPDSRRMWDQGLMKNRPPSPKSATRAKPNYKLVTPPLPPRNKVPGSGPQTEYFLGITLWRLRASQSGDEARILVQGAATHQSPDEQTPERIGLDTDLQEGQKIRFTIESPSNGYLYVIDRDKYADGSKSEPYLIFPVTRMHGGDNQVTAGRLIEIPAQEDDPPVITVQKTRADHIGESITIIVSQKPLGVSVGRQPVKLSAALVAEWERKWSTQTAQGELAESQGKAWTKAEQEAGKDTKRILKQDEPSPQCIFWIRAKPGNPPLFKFDLRYSTRK